MKKILTGLSTAAIALLVSCGGGDDTTSSNYYVSEQVFANGSVSISSGINLALMKVTSYGRVDNTASAGDGDGTAIVVSGLLQLDTNSVAVYYSYNVGSDGVGVLDVLYLDGESGSSVDLLFTESLSNVLGLPWDNDYVVANYDSVSAITTSYDMISGLCQTTVTYTTSAGMIVADPVVSTWSSYIVER